MFQNADRYTSRNVSGQVVHTRAFVVNTYHLMSAKRRRRRAAGGTYDGKTDIALTISAK